MTDITTTYTAADALKYAAALLWARADWTGDSISGSDCKVDHETELGAIHEMAREIRDMAAQFGDLMRYSDGRRVEQYAQIETGLVTHHIWLPNPTTEPPTSWRSALPHDPGEPSPGVYEVNIDPMTQSIDVTVVRAL